MASKKARRKAKKVKASHPTRNQESFADRGSRGQEEKDGMEQDTDNDAPGTNSEPSPTSSEEKKMLSQFTALAGKFETLEQVAAASQ